MHRVQAPIYRDDTQDHTQCTHVYIMLEQDSTQCTHVYIMLERLCMHQEAYTGAQVHAVVVFLM